MFNFFRYFCLFCFEFCWSHSLIHCCCCCCWPGLPPNRFVWFYAVALGRTTQSNSIPPACLRPRPQLQSSSSSTLLCCSIRFAITQVLNENQLKIMEENMMYDWCIARWWCTDVRVWKVGGWGGVLDNTYSDSCRSAACGSRRVDPLRSGTVAGQRRSEIVVVALKGIALSFFQF